MHKIEAEAIIKDYEAAGQSLDDFVSNLECVLISKTSNSIEFDLKGCHPSLANALRRIMIADVPTMAIENVFIYENNTIFPDEYLAHRLGLIPMNANADEFTDYDCENEDYGNTLSFKLHKVNNTDEVINCTSDDIEFCPIEGQDTSDTLLKKNVLICKLAPRNEIEMIMKATKGSGETHAKWSPVSLCSYRIMPRIVLERDFYGEEAVELQKCFSDGVIGIVDGRAVVVNPRADSLSREVLRHEKFKDNVKLLRESGWFCFTVETIAEDPLVVVKKAIRILIESTRNLKEELKQLNESYD